MRFRRSSHQSYRGGDAPHGVVGRPVLSIGGARLLAVGSCLAMLIPRDGLAQGLRSSAVSVTLIVSKPGAGDRPMTLLSRTHQDLVVTPPTARGIGDRHVRLDHTSGAEATLWVRDASGRLTQMTDQWIAVPARGSLAFRIAGVSRDGGTSRVWQVRYREGGDEIPLLIVPPMAPVARR